MSLSFCYYIKPAIMHCQVLNKKSSGVWISFPHPEFIVVCIVQNAIIPISRFNKGEASKIFEEVIQAGIKIVVKNNKPACVLLSPDEYQRILDDMEDYVLLKEALQRLEKQDSSLNITQEELLKKYSISQKLLDETEVDFE